MSWLAHVVRYALVHWGYLALAAGLLAEDAGLPVPGETVLMFASFVSHRSDRLSLPLIVVIGTLSAILGDNIGFFAGRHFGTSLLGWLRRKFHMDDDIAIAGDQIQRHGSATIFWARYIFGLRAIAGPVAGALGMPWKRFLLFNSLGAVTWVSTIACLGFAFSREFHNFSSYFEKLSWAVAGGVLGIGYFIWRRRKRQFRAHRTGRQGSAAGSSGNAKGDEA